MKRLFLLLGVFALIGAGCFGQGGSDGNGSQNGNSDQNDSEERSIVLESPEDGDEVTSPLVVSGRARVFENAVSYRILQGGNVVKEGHFIANAQDVGEFGDFEERIFLPAMDDEEFTLEVFNFSARDGEMENVERVDVKLGNTEKTTFNVYFVDPELAQTDCSELDFEKRTIAKTQNVAEAALEELLAGPESDWAVSEVPIGTTLESVGIANGIATVEFQSPGLNQWNGGSCHVTALRAQIVDTLTQFPTVDEVVIRVNGEEDEIFQP